ncbi:hypothetical protein DM02DRAFT_723411 [Periconia macrospinosa]|uniref:Uncharacterized protein n=1 Tax=Periconia macrospinosa TaxID=97972 RepID=A0A2V1EAU5_9PLEO|nr:hypothetical protein DM02DRAFT_723411 [Periconia macrospinosa]
MPIINKKPSLPKMSKKKRLSTDLIPPLPSSPLPPEPSLSPSITPPTHYLTQWESNVVRLAKKERSKATFTAEIVQTNLEYGPRCKLPENIRTFKLEDPIRSGDDDDDTATVKKSSTSSPVTARVRPRSEGSPVDPETPSRALLIPQSLFAKSTEPVSPMGNAWSGEHFWEPSFSPKSPEDIAFKPEEKDPPSPFRPSSPRDCVAYQEILDTVDAVANGIRSEYGAEAEAEASLRVLEAAAEEYDTYYSLPQPHQTLARLDVDKKKRFYFDLPAAGRRLMWATKVYDDVRLPPSAPSSVVDDSGDEAEYNTMLKSINEELEDGKRPTFTDVADPLSPLARMRPRGEERRLKGRAPSIDELMVLGRGLRRMGLEVDEVKEEDME